MENRDEKGRRKEGKKGVTDPAARGTEKVEGGKGREERVRITSLVGAVVSPPPVASENATGAGEEANKKGDEGAEG